MTQGLQSQYHSASDTLQFIEEPYVEVYAMDTPEATIEKRRVYVAVLIGIGLFGAMFLLKEFSIYANAVRAHWVALMSGGGISSDFILREDSA